MAKKSIKLNYIYNVSYQILLLLTPLITTPYTSRVLGAEGIGQYSFTSSIVSYFLLFAGLGTGTYGQREISYSQEDREKRSNVFWEIFLIRFYTTIICSIPYFIFIARLKFPILYVIQYLTIFNVFLDITWLFQGMEEFGKIVFRNAIIKIINILYIFAVIRSEDDLNLYVFGFTILSLVSSLSLWAYLPSFVDRVSFKNIRIAKHWKPIIALFIPTIAIQIYTVLDKTMIGLFTISKVENGYYEQALKLSKMVLTLVTSLGTVMIPRIGYFFNQNDKEHVRIYMYRAYNFVWFLGVPLCFGLIGISTNVVPWFYGDNFQAVAPLLSVLSFMILAIGVNNVTGMQYMIPTKRENKFTLTVCIGAVVNFLLNLILIPNYHAAGAAIASVTAETIIALIQLYIVRKEFSVPKVFMMSWKYFFAGGLMLLLLKIEANMFLPSIVNTVVMVVSGAIVYFILLLFMRDEFLILNLASILRQTKNKLKK